NGARLVEALPEVGTRLRQRLGASMSSEEEAALRVTGAQRRRSEGLRRRGHAQSTLGHRGRPEPLRGGDGGRPRLAPGATPRRRDLGSPGKWEEGGRGMEAHPDPPEWADRKASGRDRRPDPRKRREGR